MSGQDAEIQHLKASVSCAALLERLPPVWRLDRAESTRRCLKYRRGAGEIVIVNHDGRGWWDPLSEAKGDVFSLVQHLEPGLNFAQARRMLRGFVGIAPTFPEALRVRGARVPRVPVARRWEQAPAPVTRISGLALSHHAAGIAGGVSSRQQAPPTPSAKAPAAVPGSRIGIGRGILTGIEMRGPTWRSFSTGGDKTLFRLPGAPGRPSRVAVCEAAIDALSLAAIESCRLDTLYTATAGGMGPATITALQQLLEGLASEPAGTLIAATDADIAGRRYAARLQRMATEAGVRFDAILPPDGLNDWNDTLRATTPTSVLA